MEFFYIKAFRRCRKNTIHHTKNDEGVWLDGHDVAKVLKYFNDLFSDIVQRGLVDVLDSLAG